MEVSSEGFPLTKIDISMDLFYRAMYPRPVVLITCPDPRRGGVNIIPVAWSIPLSLKPPLVGVSIAPQRHSHNLIAEAGEFVVNIPTSNLLDQTALCGSKSGLEGDKFALSRLTPKPSKTLRTPIIDECPAHLECLLRERVATGDHTLFVGEVKAAYAEEGFVKGGFVNLEGALPLQHLGKDYYTTPSRELLTPKR